MRKYGREVDQGGPPRLTERVQKESMIHACSRNSSGLLLPLSTILNLSSFIHFDIYSIVLKLWNKVPKGQRKIVEPLAINSSKALKVVQLTVEKILCLEKCSGSKRTGSRLRGRRGEGDVINVFSHFRCTFGYGKCSYPKRKTAPRASWT